MRKLVLLKEKNLKSFFRNLPRLKISNCLANIIAVLLLVLVFFLSVLGARKDSATFDEPAFIVGGYSHLVFKDYRFDLDHPPLVTDLMALPLLFLNLNFDKNHPAWTAEGDYKWWIGSDFLYHSGNNADKILFWARLPTVFILIFLGWFLFYWTKMLAGNKIALVVLVLFCFSPNFLAHGHLSTLDVAATLGVVLSIYSWLEFLKKPTRKNVILNGLIFGVVMLIKSSLIILVPCLGVITVIYAWLNTGNLRGVIKYLGLAILIGIIGIIFVIWPVYQFHVLNYPIERQLDDTNFYLSSQLSLSKKQAITESFCLWLVSKPMLRGLAQFLLGILINLKVAAGGTSTVTYFLGKLSHSGWWYYFPAIYFLKIPLAFHILTLIAISTALFLATKCFLRAEPIRYKEWLKYHFTEFSMGVFLIIYWLNTLNSKLNIGIRHLLPVFPFIYILVCLGIKNWINSIKSHRKNIAIFFIFILIGWYIASSLFVFPHYLSYFNELIGGSKNGYKYVVDSNYDWGQDLKRLRKWVDSQKIERIYVDYFGGGDIEYYLGDRAIPFYGSSWWAYWGKMQKPQDLPKGSYLAVSATFLQGGWGGPDYNFDNPIMRDYEWLDSHIPIARAGNSIFIYYIDTI